MKDRISPYSTKALRALVETLKLHGAMLVMDPEANVMRVRHLAKITLDVPRMARRQAAR